MHRVDAVIAATARHFDVAAADLVGPSRLADMVLIRSIAMWVAADLTGKSLPELGRRFGDRDHTTVLHALRKVETLRKDLPAVAEAIAAVQGELRDAGVRGLEEGR